MKPKIIQYAWIDELVHETVDEAIKKLEDFRNEHGNCILRTEVDEYSGRIYEQYAEISE